MSFRMSTRQQIPSSRITLTRSAPQFSSASMHGGSGGWGSRISSGPAYSLRSGAPVVSSSTAFKVSSGMGGGVGAINGGSGAGILGNERGAMQNLNDRLANYLETVRNLERANKELEEKIREALEKGGPDMRDYSKYEPIIEDLRRQIFDKIAENASLDLQIDNARLASDDFKMKYENEMAIRQSVEADINGLKKLIDDTNGDRMNLESEIDNLNEDLNHLKKNHEDDVRELRNQVSQSGVQVDIDAPKGQDLSEIMEGIRTNYEKSAMKNAEDLKNWHENQIADVQVQVSQNTEALKGAQGEKGDLARQIQNLQIELESQRSLKNNLENTLNDIKLQCNMDMENCNGIILGLEAELTKLCAKIKDQTHEYEALLNMKLKLEAEINTYKSLLDGGDFK